MPNINDMQQGMRKAFKTPDEQSPSFIQKIQEYFNQQRPQQIQPTQPELNREFLQGVQSGFTGISPEQQAKREALLALQRRGF